MNDYGKVVAKIHIRRGNDAIVLTEAEFIEDGANARALDKFPGDWEVAGGEL